MEDDPRTDLAIAGGAIVSALIDLMVSRGDLTRGEVLTVLGDAQKWCVELKGTGPAAVCAKLYQHYQATEI